MELDETTMVKTQTFPIAGVILKEKWWDMVWMAQANGESGYRLKWIQTSVVEFGESGSLLFDHSGNVHGIVYGLQSTEGSDMLVRIMFMSCPNILPTFLYKWQKHKLVWPFKMHLIMK